MLFSFFRGMGLMGYVVTGLAAVIIMSWTTIFFMGRNINNLHEEIGVSEAAIELLVDVNAKSYSAARSAEAELKRCTNMRTSAEANANEATERAGRKTRDSYIASDDRRDQISEQINQDSSSCGNLPTRATELLIEAASSANGNGGDT